MPDVHRPSAGMLTDRYELTMLTAFVKDGHVDRRASFEAFARGLPQGRRYGMVAGLGRLLELVEEFRFTPDEVAWLRSKDVVDDDTADYLRDFRFRGDIDAYPEGELYFPRSPVLTVTGGLGECLVLETLVLSVLNHDTAVASAAARMMTAAKGRPLVEMGGRRTHEHAAIAAARAAYLAGFESTSNLAAGQRYGIRTRGTAAHAFTLAHADEESAFRSQVEAQGVGTTLLVDTFDVEQGIRTAVKVAGPELGAVRIDSGDLAEEAHRARALLDELGATETRIVATSDIDEYLLAELAHAPIDRYGVGTRLVTGSGHPTAAMVYKLVSVAGTTDGLLRPVEKKSADKISAGGVKQAFREDDGQHVVRETFTVDWSSAPGRPLQVDAMRGGKTVHAPTFEEMREHAATQLATLPPDALDIEPGLPYLTATLISRGAEQ